ncbi:MAG: hypothetical protein M3Y93_01040, partial [Pseudomonadota bacterium]|nr:hypothetical protein [Pseudomonadota bacterium]
MRGVRRERWTMQKGVAEGHASELPEAQSLRPSRTRTARGHSRSDAQALLQRVEVIAGQSQLV